MESWLEDWDQTALAAETVAALPAEPFLFPEERPVFEALKAERRRREWYAGRRAARRALASFGYDGPILPDAEGAPQVGAKLGVSLSHGPRRAVALAWRGADRLGIDLVDGPEGPRVRRVMERWCKPQERALMTRGPDWAPGLLWGAREAVAKASRTGMFAYALGQVWVTELQEDGAELNLSGVELRWTRRDGELWVAARMPTELAFELRAQAERPRSVYES
ncbi:MAG: 4'-phosphopantetheinyl transferase superfamily protein [Myxococcota bacterium]